MSKDNTSSSLSDLNKSYFNTSASKYDKHPMRLILAKKSADAILTSAKTKNLFDENKTRVLDFACGSGLVTQHLAPYVQSILGVDSSEGMVKEFNLKCFNQGIMDDIKAICVDLTNEKDMNVTTDSLLSRLGVQTPFDIVICVQAFHHIQDIQSITRILALLLKSHGALYVVDLINDPGNSAKFHHTASHNTVAHHGGFTIEEIKHAFHANNDILSDITVEKAFSFSKLIESEDKEYSFDLFLASAIRRANDGNK